MAPMLADIAIPNPIDVVTDVISAPAGWAWDKVASGIASWVLGAVEYFVGGITDFLGSSVSPDVGAAWFAGSGSPYATVRGIAVMLLLAFLFLGIIQGLIAGDTAAMVRRVTVDLPAAVFGMVTTTVVVGKLLELTDALSAAVLANSGGQALHFLSGFGAAANTATNGFAAVLLGLVAVIAGLLVWIELMVRSVLVYILVALSPLSFAAMVWPSARGLLRRTIELLLAVILSKLVICIAISVGVAALAGAGTAAPRGSSAPESAGASLGALFVGAAILAMAAFAPFLVLKLIPWAEAALIAQGVSRSPVRATQATMSNVYYAQSLMRLAGGHGSRAGGSPAATSTSGEGWTVGPQAIAADTTANGTTGVGVAGGPVGVVAAGTVAVGTTAANTALRTAESSADTAGSLATPRDSTTTPVERRQGADAPEGTHE